jgi:5-oxoprolinase (ATP-hydrolysing)
LALTDANLILNRLDPIYFPKIFGKNKDEGPNKDASLKAFELLAEKINNGATKKSIYEIAEGFI